MSKKIILASTSPRRKQILEQAGLSFIVSPANYDEAMESLIFDYKKIEDCAFYKAQFAAKLMKEEAYVIGADTVVVNNGLILGKPKNEQEAFLMLKSLSGKEHFVVTSVCVVNTKTQKIKTTSVTSFVEFHNLSDTMIKDYIKKFKPFDKAGAYGIQELPEGFLKNLKGSMENVMGLSSEAVIRLLSLF